MTNFPKSMCCDKGGVMKDPGSQDDIGQEIDDLIRAGWSVIETDFDPKAFKGWRARLGRVTALLTDDEMFGL